MNRNHQRTSKLSVARFATAALALLFVMALFVPTLSAQQAPAGAVIGNQASATYLDASSVSRQSFSNLVQTSVTQVYGGSLANTQTRYATVGTQVVFPHTYTNSGNGIDTLYFTVGTNANITNQAIYIDANGDGVPDNTTNISGSANTFVVGPGQTFKFVVVGTLIAGSTSGTSYSLSVTPTESGAHIAPAANTDTIIATSNAAINVTKSMTVTSGPQGTASVVTLTYTNTGNATSGPVVIADPLGSTTAAFLYVTGSKWNGVALTDGGAEPAGVTSFTTTGNTPTLTLPSVAPGVTGTLTFNVTVGTAAPIGLIVNNTANFNYTDLLTGGTAIPSANTNTVGFLVSQTAGVSWTAGDTGDFTGTAPNGTDALGAKTVGQGGTITWTDTLTNTGNGYDTFNITAGTSTFPAGTTFQFYRIDGVTPLTDSNGDGIVDSGPVAAGGTATIKVTATLPTSTTTGAAWSLQVKATSTASTASNFSTVAVATDTDTVTVTITSSAVDLTVTASANTGAEPGKGVGIASGVTNTVAPGQQTIFPFFVQNTSTVTGTADSYNLLVQGYSTAGNVTPTVAGTALPSGWTVLIHQATGATCPGSYSAQSTAVANTPALSAAGAGNLAASYQLYCVELDVPANSTAGTNDFIITANSNSTAAVDQMTFAVTVSAINAVTISPNQSGQVYAGGTIAYTHVITNGGNTSQTVSFPSATAIVFNPSTAGWSGVLYQPGTGDTTGALDANSTAITPGSTTITLAGGASALVFFKVQSSPAANPGDNSSATLTISYNGGTLSTVTDVTTVISGQVKLVKSQYVDTGCTKTAGTFTTLSANASSGQCIIYQIVATNTGQTNVSNLTIADAAPPYTTYLTGYTTTSVNTCTLTGGAVTVTGGGTTGFTAAFTGSMTPSCTATITFEVKLN
jgi:uncharacterized repeat protein (TIGR01451 family)